MEKYTADKLIDGTITQKFTDSRYFYIFTSFILFWDVYSHSFSGESLLLKTYRLGDSIAYGNIFFLIVSFSLLASVVSPLVFWVSNSLFWSFWYAIPDKIRPEESVEKLSERISCMVQSQNLKMWALKNNNSLAMSIANDSEKEMNEMNNNRPYPFLLALCIGGNYIFSNEGALRKLEQYFNSINLFSFRWCLLFVISALLYFSFNAISRNLGYIYLPGLKKHIESLNGKT